MSDLLLCTVSIYIFFLNSLMTVSILDSSDMTPLVGNRFLIKPPTQRNMDTEKSITYRRPSSEIQKNEAVFEWFSSIVLSKDTCISY